VVAKIEVWVARAVLGRMVHLKGVYCEERGVRSEVNLLSKTYEGVSGSIFPSLSAALTGVGRFGEQRVTL